MNEAGSEASVRKSVGQKDEEMFLRRPRRPTPFVVDHNDIPSMGAFVCMFSMICVFTITSFQIKFQLFIVHCKSLSFELYDFRRIREKISLKITFIKYDKYQKFVKKFWDVIMEDSKVE